MQNKKIIIGKHIMRPTRLAPTSLPRTDYTVARRYQTAGMEFVSRSRDWHSQSPFMGEEVRQSHNISNTETNINSQNTATGSNGHVHTPRIQFANENFIPRNVGGANKKRIPTELAHTAGRHAAPENGGIVFSVDDHQPAGAQDQDDPGDPTTLEPATPNSEEREYSFPLPAYQAPHRPGQTVKKRSLRKRAVKITGGLLAIVLFFGGAVGLKGYFTASKVFTGTATVTALSSGVVAPEKLSGEGDGRVNILLLGVGGAEHDGGDLTDTMMVASLDPLSGKVTLLSIPRDLWVEMPSKYYGQYQKINAAYSAGKYNYLRKADQSSSDTEAIKAGLASVDQAVEQVIGQKINYHVLVNFKAFEEAVNVLGTITVNVKEKLVDPSMAWENDNNPVLADIGIQQMDGKKALIYARSRHSTSDFSRSERQRELILALKDRATTLSTFTNPAKMSSLLETFGSNVYTDLSPQAVLRIYSLTKNTQSEGITSIDFVTKPTDLVTTSQINGLSVVIPKSGVGNYEAIQLFVGEQLRDGYLARENAEVVVVAPDQSKADATKTALQKLGYRVTGVQVAASKPPEAVVSVATPQGLAAEAATRVVDLSSQSKPYTRSYLAKRYGANMLRHMPSELDVPPGTKFVILVEK